MGSFELLLQPIVTILSLRIFFTSEQRQLIGGAHLFNGFVRRITLRFKKIITGVMIAAMITGMCATEASAEGKKKTKNYHEYAAELDKIAYDGNDLGAEYSKKSTSFKVWAPKASSVKVNLYEKGSKDEGGKKLKTKDMTLDKSNGVWSASISGDLEGVYYTYSVNNGGDVKETADIYARACGVNGKRSMVVDLSKTDPENWKNDTHVMVSQQTNATVWEISVADFSSNENSGVQESHRGKYLAFTESGTTVDSIQGGTATCVDYLKRLGVKYVQIMPMYDFGSVDESKDIMEQYNWGYDPVNYNCPEGSYSTDPYDGKVRIKECKQMIQALHNAGIGVIMDVVYNHTYSTESSFQYTVPNYYYRMNDDGTFSNGSGCSNDTASEHLMFRKFMVDSVTYWAKEYHIDGFRFDLMGLHDVTTMNEIRAALDHLYDDGSGEKIIMYGEAWNMPTNAAPDTLMANQSNVKLLNNRIGAFDDTIRDAIKGSTGGSDGGFIQSGSGRAALKTGFLGQCGTGTGWANTPTQCVNYASCHDNICLWDKLVDSVLKNKEYRQRSEELISMNKLSAAIVMTAQGIPFFLGGEEFARSKDGDENSYSSSREENQLDWSLLNTNSDLVEYYRGLIKIREAFAALSDYTAMTANNITTVDELPSGVSAYIINNTEDDKWKKLCVVFNGSDEKKDVAVEGEWVRIADELTAGLRNLGECAGSVSVKPHSAAILVDKKSYASAGIEDYEGALVVNYYDNKTKEKLKTQVVCDELGRSYDIENIVSGLNYDLKSSSGDVSGEFSEKTRYADVYVEPYDGKMATVTVKFVDDINGTELADSYSIRNREGQQYYTPVIPTIEGYRLVLDQFPKNGAGLMPAGESTVEYKYTKITDDTDRSVCIVNVIYMNAMGEVIETETLTGKEGETYTAEQHEYEDMNLIEIPHNIQGVFSPEENNVLFNYSSHPDPFKGMLIGVGIAAGVIAVLCVISAVLSRVRRKERLRNNMDIVDEAEDAEKAEKAELSR